MSIKTISLEDLDGAPSPRYGHSTCIVDDLLYLYGGCSPDGKVFFNDLHVLDLQKMKWIEKHSADGVTTGRHFHTCTFDTQTVKLIFFGGKSNGYRNDVFTYDLSTKLFELIEPRFKDGEKVSSCVNDDCQPPTPRYGHSACYYNNRIFIFGGYDKNGFTKNDLYCFYFQTNMWRRYIIAKMPYRYHHSGILIDGNYFILGGITKSYTPLNDAYRLDLTRAQENEKDDHGVEAFELSIENPIASWGHKCFVLNDKIYMYGGRDEEQEFKHLLRLEIQQNNGSLRWREERDNLIDESKLHVSYCSIDLYNIQKNTMILFFGGQYRGESKKQKEEEEEGEIGEKGPMCLEDLPYDCLFYIFESYLGESEIIQVASTSKRWMVSTAARSDRLWIRKYEDSRKVSPIDSMRMKRVKRQRSSFKKYVMLRAMEREYKIEESKKKPDTSFSWDQINQMRRKGEIEHVKTVMVGDGAVGKTCLNISYALARFPEEYVPTVFDNCNAVSWFQEKRVCLALWDTAGEEDYDRLRPLSYPETNVFSMCFSLVSPTSLENIKAKWYPEINHHAPSVPIVLIGTKLDLREDPRVLRQLQERDEKTVSTEEGRKVAREIGAFRYFETSAKTRENIQECFQGIIAGGLGLDEKDGKKGGKGGCGIM